MIHSQNILDYYCESNTGYLHPKGRKATKLLLAELNLQQNENVLEFGYGTGATITFFSSIYKKTNFYGIDYNELMYTKAKSRLKFCRIKNATLEINNSQTSLPYENDFFDKIYIESVLAILEGDNLKLIFHELKRVLKPKGKLIINEGIWSETFSIEIIKEMNTFCKFHFGIIQANEKYPYINDWEKLIERIGFEVDNIHNLKIDLNKKVGIKKMISLSLFLSNLFSSYGNFKSKMNKNNKLKHLNYKKAMSITSKKGNYLNGYLIMCTKK